MLTARWLCAGAGVTAVAAVLHHPQLREEIKGKQVAVVLTGGNIESSLLVRSASLHLSGRSQCLCHCSVIDKGLVSDHRVARIRGKRQARCTVFHACVRVQ